MKPKYRYNKYVKWGARQILLEIAKHIDENNLIDIDVAEEIKAYAKHEAKAMRYGGYITKDDMMDIPDDTIELVKAAARMRFTWER